jgi:hypothetical protein
MTIVFMILMAIFVIVFFVFVWKSALTWRWYHLVLASVVMLLALTFLFPSAGVFKSRAAWNQMQIQLEDQLKRAKAENERLREGDANQGEGLLELQRQLQKLGAEAGRVWRDLQMQNATPQGITLAPAPMPAAEGLPGGPAPAAENGEANANAGAASSSLSGLSPGLIVYGFAETPGPEQQTTLPTFYLGEFRVTASDANSVTIAATGNLTPQQLQAINNNQASRWSLYEMLPLDGHEPFIVEGSVPTDAELFGRVDQDLVNRLLGNRVSSETLDAYLRDGSQANANDPPESRWVKVEFTKPYTVDVDSTDQRGALDGGFFDSVGRAVDSRLQGGDDGNLTFAAGEQLVVKEEAAEQLLQDGVAKRIDTYFVRPLNDYRFALRRLQNRIAEMEYQRNELQYQIQVIQDAVDDTEAMLVQNQQDKLKLEKDVAQVGTELKAIQTYRQNLAETLADTRQQLVSLYRSNLQLTQQLSQAHQTLQTEIDARSEADSL